MTPAPVALNRLRHALRFAVRRTRDTERALQAGELLGGLDWLNEDGLLSEEAVEEAVHARHGEALARAAPPTPEATVDWLHVISEALPVGGHTRLLKMVAKAQLGAGATVRIAVTRSTDEGFRDRLAAAGADISLLSGTRAECAAALIALGRATGRIVLHIHPDDLGAAVAARRLCAEGRRVLFVNHADHCFSYGPGAAEVCLEVSGFGWGLTAAGRAAAAQSFLGIPVTDEDAPSPLRPPAARGGPVVSVGSPWKYRPADGLDFPAFAAELLDRTDVTLEVVGPDPKEPWWANALARHPKRLRLLGLRPFEETEARLATATAYVDSFPGSGGTAFPQALMSGLDVFGPKRRNAGDYGLADALRFPSVAEMTDALVAFLRSGVPPKGQAAVRPRIATEFSAQAVAARLEAAAEGRLQTPPPELMTLRPKAAPHRTLRELTFNFDQACALPMLDRAAMLLAMRGHPTRGVGAPRGRRARLAWLLGDT